MWTDNSAISYQLFDAIRRLTAGCVSKIADLQAYIALRYAAFKLVDLLFLMHGPVLPYFRATGAVSGANSKIRPEPCQLARWTVRACPNISGSLLIWKLTAQQATERKQPLFWTHMGTDDSDSPLI